MSLKASGSPIKTGATISVPSSSYSSRSKQSRSTRRGKRGKYITRTEINGGIMNVPPNPPEVAYQPWMPVTLVHQVNGTEHVTVRDIVMKVTKQLDPMGHAFKDFGDKWSASETIMQIRVRSIRAWNLTGKIITLSVDDYSDAAKAIADVDTLCGIVDTGSSLHVPAVGYTLPSSHRNIVLRNDKLNSSAIIYHVSTASTDIAMVYCSIFIRFDGPASFSSFQDGMFKIVSEIRDKIDINTDVLRKIHDHDKGDIGTVIVNGISKAAPYVLAATATDDYHMLVERIRELELKLSDNASTYSSVGEVVEVEQCED